MNGSGRRCTRLSTAKAPPGYDRRCRLRRFSEQMRTESVSEEQDAVGNGENPPRAPYRVARLKHRRDKPVSRSHRPWAGCCHLRRGWSGAPTPPLQPGRSHLLITSAADYTVAFRSPSADCADRNRMPGVAPPPMTRRPARQIPTTYDFQPRAGPHRRAAGMNSLQPSRHRLNPRGVRFT